MSILLFEEADVRMCSKANARFEALAGAGCRARNRDGSRNVFINKRWMELQDTLARGLFNE
jgi:hypothetical protein